MVIGTAEYAAQAAAVDLLEQHHEPGLRQHVDDHSDDAADDAHRWSSRSTARCATSISSRPRRARYPAGFQFEFPQVGTTGRTAVQATAVNTLTVHGSAKNFTVSRAPVPFSSEASGVGYLHKATFGGNADAVGLDVNGKIGKLTFKTGLGNPAGVFTAKSSFIRPAAAVDDLRNASGHDRISRRRTLRRHDPGQQHRQAHGLCRRTCSSRPQQNPDFVQLGMQGYPTYAVMPGLFADERGDHHVGLDRQRERAGHRAQQRGQDGLRLHSVRRRASRGRAVPATIELLPPARRPGQQRQSPRASVPPTTITTRRPAPPVRARSRSSVPAAVSTRGGVTGLGNTGAGLFARTIKRLRVKR